MQAKILTIGFVINSALILILELTLVAMEAPVESFALSVVLASCGRAFVLLLASSLSTQGIKTLGFSRQFATLIFSKSIVLTAAFLFGLLYMKGDRILMRYLSTVPELGSYALASRILDLAIAGLAVLPISFTPALIREVNRNVAIVESRAIRLMSSMFYLALFAVIFLCCFCQLVIPPRVFEEYAMIYPLSCILLLSLPVYSLNLVVVRLLIAARSYSVIFCMAFLGAVVSIVANLNLIPRYGAIAAAWILSATVLLVTLIVPLYSKHGRTAVRLAASSIVYPFFVVLYGHKKK